MRVGWPKAEDDSELIDTGFVDPMPWENMLGGNFYPVGPKVFAGRLRPLAI
jgi:hypothetical protein